MKKPASVTGIKLVGLHRQSFENAIGNNWHNIVHPDDVQLSWIYTYLLLKKEPYFIPAIRIKRHDGEYLWHSVQANPILR
jgi:hypothetical protein